MSVFFYPFHITHLVLHKAVTSLFMNLRCIFSDLSQIYVSYLVFLHSASYKLRTICHDLNNQGYLTY
jgi:hypothetical protein